MHLVSKDFWAVLSHFEYELQRSSIKGEHTDACFGYLAIDIDIFLAYLVDLRSLDEFSREGFFLKCFGFALPVTLA